MPTLSALQHDALVELFNIGVGQAASALSDIVGDEVRMAVPTLCFLARAAAAALLAGEMRIGGAHADDRRGDVRVCGVRQHYDGAFRTEAIVMFAEDKSLDIVRLMVGDAVPFEELTAMEQEAMGEIGNIALNSCVGTLANLFGSELRGSLPVVQLGSSASLLGTDAGSEHNPVVLMLGIDLALDARRIHGYIAFVLDMAALDDLLVLVDRWLARGTAQHQPTPPHGL